MRFSKNVPSFRLVLGEQDWLLLLPWHPELILVWEFCIPCLPTTPQAPFLGVVLLAKLPQVGLCRGHLKKK